MSYFIFLKNLDNIEGTIYRIAENQLDLDNLNISQSAYKIIEDSQNNFNLVKYGNKFPIKYDSENITYIDYSISFIDKQQLQNYIDSLKKNITPFLDNNLSHPSFNIWNDYFNQLTSLDLDTITYPLNKSLEQYFNDQNKPSLNPLQLP
jgi:hypothetical protein